MEVWTFNTRAQMLCDAEFASNLPDKRPIWKSVIEGPSFELKCFVLCMVGAAGFEPATPCAQGRCATRLRYAPTFLLS